MSSIGTTTALKAIFAAQLSMQTTGHNIANANVEGYSRQSVLLTTDNPVIISGVGRLGTGVKASGIIRTADKMLEARINHQNQSLGRLEKETTLLSQVENLFNEPSDGGLSSLFNKFFSSLNAMSLDPVDPTLRSDVVIAGEIMADGFNMLSKNLNAFKDDVQLDIKGKVERINQLASQISEVNEKISMAHDLAAQPNELLDKRNQLVKEMNYIIDADMVENSAGQVSVLVDGRVIAGAGYTHDLVYATDVNGQGSIRLETDPTALQIRDGEIYELLDQQNNTVPNLLTEIDTMAGQLIYEFNKVHSTGVPLSGPFTVLRAENRVGDTNLDGDARNDPLNMAGLPFTPTSGSLFVSVTNKSTNEMMQYEIPFDPVVQNLNDLTSALNAIPNLGAYADPQGQLTIHANQGYGFDFSTQLDPKPDKTNSFGTVDVTMEGAYTGAANTSYRFEAAGTGEIGVTAGLQVNVFDTVTGAQVGVLNVGPGYSPGDMIEVANGVKVSFGPGSIDQVAGDSFTSTMIADSDEGGLLSALGLNTFFTGSKASDMEVREKLKDDPTLIAGALSPYSGDNANVLRMAELETKKLSGLNNISAIDYYSSTIGQLGLDKQWADEMYEVQTDLMANLENQRASVSGVSIDEEMLNLEKYQQMLEASTQYLSVMNEVMDSLMAIV